MQFSTLYYNNFFHIHSRVTVVAVVIIIIVVTFPFHQAQLVAGSLEADKPLQFASVGSQLRHLPLSLLATTKNHTHTHTHPHSCKCICARVAASMAGPLVSLLVGCEVGTHYILLLWHYAVFIFVIFSG